MDDKNTTCSKCGAPLKQNAKKYCSSECYAAARWPKDWIPEAVRLCVENHWGCGRIAKELKMSKGPVWQELTRRGLINPEKHRATAIKDGIYSANATLAINRKEKDAFIHLRNAFNEETKKVVKFDETIHWSRHSIARVWHRRNMQNLRIQSCPQRRLVRAMRMRVWKMLKIQNQRKHGRRTMAFLGCCPIVLSQWLESQWVDGMTWQNYGNSWEVDHIKPCASFDLSIQFEVNECFHFTNLAPLWRSDNRRKSAHYGGAFHHHKKLMLVRKAA
jgi:hypothetical protein